MEPSTRAMHAEPTETNTLLVSASVDSEPGVKARCTPCRTPAASPAAAAAVSPTLAPAPQAGKRGGTLILARQGDVTNLDPQKVPAFTSQRVFELVYSRLTSLTADLTVQPDLAESWTVSGDGKTYTFKLRQAKWHNGDPVTSADVKFTFDRILTVDGSVAKSLFTDIDHVDTPDGQTVTFVLKQPNVTILPYMAIIEDAQTAHSLRQEDGITLDARPSPNYNLLCINTARKPFDNVKVRQAISYAIDRQQIIDAVALGEGEATGPIAPALTQYALPVSQYPSYARDVAKAKQLLQEANVGPIEFTMLTETTEPVYAKDIAQLVQAQLAEIGVKMNIQTLEFTQWVDRWLKADFDMSPGLNGGGPDPDFYIFRHLTHGGNLNFVPRYKNPVSSDAIKQARATTDATKRKDLYTTAQKELVNGVPFIWLFVGRDYVATLPTTKGFTHLPTGSIIYLRQTWLDK